MQKIYALLTIVIALLTIQPAAGSRTYFVAPNGNDSNKGTIGSPFATINHTLAAIREQRKKGIDGNFSIYLRKGVYEISSTIEMNNTDYDVAIRPYRKEKVTLSGGKTIDPSFAIPVLGSSYEPLFQQAALPYIRYINLRKLGITSYGELHNVGFARPSQPAWMEVFIDSKPGILARWPNMETVAIGKVTDEGSVPRNGDYSNRGGTFTFDGNRPSQWHGLGDIWISGYFRHGYAEDAIRVASIDTILHRITTDKPHRYGFGSGSPWNRWYAYNIASEIDMEGEYYIDRQNGVLFFYSAQKPTTIEVSQLETPIIALEGSKDINIKGISFTASRGMAIYMEQTEGCRIEECQFVNLGAMAISIGKGVYTATDGNQSDIGEPKSRVIGSLQEYIYTNSTFNREGGSNNGIIGCSIYNTGSGGIVMSGGNRQTLTPGNNFVERCTIYSYNRIEKSYRAGIDISGVGNRITGCEIYNAPSMAILLHGNDHLIEYNDIHDVCLEVDDQGALYYGRDPSESGNIVRYNYFHHLGNEHRTTAVYHDDGACGMTVFGNIFLKAGTFPALIGGGSHNIYQNNLFVDSPTAIHIDNRLQTWSASTLDKNGIFRKRLDAVNYSMAPYAQLYPWLATYWDSNPAKPSHNIVEANIFCKIESVVHGNKSDLEWSNNNVVIDQLPASWSDKMSDRRFIPSAEQLIQPKGWKPIPIHKIGPRTKSCKRLH